MFTTFKICMNCGGRAGLRRRSCRKCGASRALFREPTQDELLAEKQQRERNEALLQELLGDYNGLSES